MTTTLKNTLNTDSGYFQLPVKEIFDRPNIITAIEKFTNVGTTSWTCPVGVTSIEVLVVAGGGGGAGGTGGGGGAGGLIYNSNYSVTPGTGYTVTVGGGGNGGVGTSSGTSGSNSVFATLTAIGGGGGGNGTTAGLSGGSGGGAGNSYNASNGARSAGTAGQGFSGGYGRFGSGGGNSQDAFSSGGGGGAGGQGGDANKNASGGGGFGLNFSITGTPTWYAGGGGGGADSYRGTYSGAGGLGGGGAGGGTNASPASGSVGVANTGGGGGGGSNSDTAGLGGNKDGAAGGSGIVVIRYSYVDTDERGTELITNGTFDSTTTGWTAVQATASIVSGQLQIVPTAGVNGGVYQAISTVAGKRYEATVYVAQDASKFCRLYIGTGNDINSSTKNNLAALPNTGVGKQSIQFTAANTTTYIWVEVGGGTSQVTKIDNLSVKEIMPITSSGALNYNTNLKDIEVYQNTATSWTGVRTYNNYAGHNLLTYSDDISNGAWNKTYVSAAISGYADPFGGSSAFKLKETAASNIQGIFQLSSDTSPAGVYCGSGYLKQSERRYATINIYLGAASNSASVLVDLQTGEVVKLLTSGLTPISYGIKKENNGFYRVYISGQMTTAGSVYLQMFMSDSANPTVSGGNSSYPTYLGDGNSGVILFRPQLEYNVTKPTTSVKTISTQSPAPYSINGYKVHAFKNVGTTTFVPACTGTVAVLVVAGGGGGCNYNSAGGGGAGGVLQVYNYPVVGGQEYLVTVGAGGTGSIGGASGTPATNGNNSEFGTLVAIGGGHGGMGNDQGTRVLDNPPGAGGSGGGARGPNQNVGGAGVPGQGNKGGNSGNYDTNYPGGGGGGAGGPGGSGIGSTIAGDGGPGILSDITGSPTWYGGGGGGSTQSGGTGGQGGIGGGGQGGISTNSYTPTAGLPNTGGGGGAGGYGTVTVNGANGGSGIVVVRYKNDN